MAKYAFKRTYGKNPVLPKRIKLIITFSIILTLIMSLLFYFDGRIRPIVEEMGVSRAKTIAMRAINEAVTEELASEDVTYDNLISIDKGLDGKVIALRTNMTKMNYIKSHLSVLILNRITKQSETAILIPLGNIINGDILSGRGPKIKIMLVPVGYVNTDIENVFASAGINQTRHQILIRVSATVSIIIPYSRSISAEVVTSICIAETVIVGAVPGTFTNVEGVASDTTDKIFIYGQDK